ncbi:uncharacterized protein [Euphorbia lathyris]|uniref:uncharacterized protein isoform X1 n=1 Tax=Euphorbia lathyris TaxID=212925 RepID=UPI003313A7B9
METNKYSSPSPFPLSSSSYPSLLKDISNSNLTSSPSPQFQNPCSSSVRPYHIRPLLSFLGKQKTANVSRFQAFELEQSQSSRKAEIEKERSLNSLAKSLTTWLNRSPMRQSDHVELNKGEEGFLSSKNYGPLRNSLKDVCAFDDLKQRMRVHSSLAACKEIFDVMTPVVKVEEIQGHSSEDAAGRFKAIKAWWQDMASQNNRFVTLPTTSKSSNSRSSIEIRRDYTRSAIVVQSHVRGWIARRAARMSRRRIGLLQTCCGKALADKTNAAVEIQRFVRGRIARKRLLGASHCNFQTSVGCNQSSELKTLLSSILKLQRWWRGVLLQKLRTKSATTIQSYIRGWIGQRRASNKRHYAVIIQAHWKGYIARKGLRGQLLDLPLRVQRSAKSVDDSMRIINRLKMAVSELLTMKSISGVLHTCATLDMTTKHSRKCCEELVAAGGIAILLKLIRSVSRSIPDQEVLKHALSTIRNLTRHQHLTKVLIDCHGSIEIIFLEFLRNKEEGYFIASEILKMICSNQNGAESLWKVPGLVKRLLNIVEELTRKATIENRSIQGVVAREKIERWGESTELLKLMATNHFNLFGLRYRNSLKIFREMLI